MKIAKSEIYLDITFCLRVTTERDIYGTPLFLFGSHGIVTGRGISPITKLIGEATTSFKTI